ncbi:MAG: DUF1572 family protein [Mariniblastus sp.]|nr:DUF1572 family protein [Mariniblastus sp.]
MNDPFNTVISEEFSCWSIDLLEQSTVKIKHCLDQLTDDQVWWRPQPSMNSIGNLLVHLAGNLRQWGVVPFTLAKDNRDRESEFHPELRRDVDELIGELDSLVKASKDQWKYLSANQLSKVIDIQGFGVSRLQAIIHASSHFVGHSHQIIQLTRLQLDNEYKFHWTPNEPRGELPI